MSDPIAEGVVEGRARPLARYPHFRRAAGLIFCSGTSARRPDDTVAGVRVREDGTKERDIRAQTEAVIENLSAILEAAGASLADLVEVNVFLVSMADYAGMNQVYDRYFDAATGPARTTVAVAALPGPDLLVEMRAVARDPRPSSGLGTGEESTR